MVLAAVDWVAAIDGPASLPFGRTGLNGLDFDTGLSLGGILALIALVKDHRSCVMLSMCGVTRRTRFDPG